MRYSGKLEYAQARRMRERNTRLYRLAHWPIWIWVFFLTPGPLTFTLFAHGFGRGNLSWLAVVLVGTGVAGLRGRLPGVEPRPYILRHCCPVKSRTESTGCRVRVSYYRSRMHEVPVKLAFFRIA
jgi:hypothetical protein